MTTTPAVAEFTAWAKAHTDLALTVCKAQAYAELKRKQVNEYLKPIFEQFSFTYPDGTPLTEEKYLYRCEDEAMWMAYYAACDVEHRKHGFDGPQGHCPALIGESLLIDAQNLLLREGADFFGLQDIPHMPEDREKMLKLLLGACLKSATPAQSRL
jgi:hypothetical protein